MSSANAATHVLEELGMAEENPPIVGDLLEEYASGRSSWWLWRQTLVIVLTSALGDVTEAQVLGLRAAATGLVAILTAGALKFRLTSPWADGVAVFWVLTWLSFLLTAWVVGLTHRRYKAAAWVYTSHFDHY